MRTSVAVALLVTASLSILPASAQSADAPALAPGENILYLHTSTGQDMWMNAKPSDGGGTNVCYKASTPTPAGDLCPNPSESFAYEFPLLPGLAHDLVLDPAGTVDVVIYWGGACCTLGQADYDLSLMSGATVVASTSGTHLMNPGAVSSVCPNDGCVYNAITANLVPSVGVIPAADGLSLSITGSGEWTHAAISTDAGRGVSSITLPIVAVIGGSVDAPDIVASALETAYTDLTEPVVQVVHDVPTNGTHQFNWTAGAHAPDLHIVGNATAGRLDVQVDAAGVSAFAWNGSGAFEHLLDLDEACGGNATGCALRFSFSLDRFVGSYGFAPHVPPESVQDAMEDNGTVAGGAQESPGVAPILTGAALFSMVALLRRRAGLQ